MKTTIGIAMLAMMMTGVALHAHAQQNMMIGAADAADVLQLGAAEGPPPAPRAASPIEAPAPQVKDALFDGTEKFGQGASDVTDVNLDRNMLGMVGGKGGNADLARKMDFVVVHSFKYDKPGMYRMEDVEAYRKKLTDGSWNCFIHTRDKSGSTDICSRKTGDTNEMVILSAELKELTFVHLRGKLSMDDLSKMGGKMGAPPPAPQDKGK